MAGKDAGTEGEKRAEEGEDARRAKRLRSKNLALLIALLAFVVLLYFVSIVRMGGS
ncbi:MAG TPA: hypothetical protein VGA50_20580 [Kiloniellales bacterium]